MRSPLGLLGSLVLLLALPIAVLTQVLLGGGSAVAIHVALAAGCGLVSFSAFDFGTPRWLAWIGCVSAGAFAVIFLLQAASTLIGNESFSYFTNEVLGFWPEKILLSLITFWLDWDVAERQPGQDEDPGFRCLGDSRVRGSVRVFRSSCPWHQPVSGDVRREVAVSTAVHLASLREREEAPRDGSVGCPLPAP